MKRISLCMIVRNEERSLARCLTSVQSLVDEICIVDTGSSDATVEIARRFGAEVVSVPWSDDFAAARNTSLAMAGGEWILILDADEEVLEPDRARAALQAFAADATPRLGRVQIENRDAEGELSTIAITRFFPGGGRFVFEGRVHEQLVKSATNDTEFVPHAETSLRIAHHGYALDESERRLKLTRNAQLLSDALTDDPQDGYLWYQLGRTRALANDHVGALEALEHGLERCPDDAPWAAGLLETGGYSLRALGRSEQALALLGQVEEQFRHRADTCFLIALLAMDCGEFERAERGFLHCLDLDGTGATTLESESSEAAATCAPAFNLGVMKEVLGDTSGAETWFRKALELRPGHPKSLAALERIGAA